MPYILLIEDHDSVIGVFRQLFASPKYDLRDVVTAEEALQLLAEQQFDLIIADYYLRGMSGTEFGQLLEKEGFPMERFVLISGYPQETTGYTGPHFYQKPFDIMTFLDTVETILTT